MLNFLHRLFHYECASCEVLKENLHEERQEKRMLLQRIMELSENKPISFVPEEKLPAPVPLRKDGSLVPWSVKRQMLEKADLIRAQELSVKTQVNQEHDKEIEKLEKELGVVNANE